MKALIIGVFCFISGLSVHAQQKDSAVKSSELSEHGALKGKDIFIKDASLDKYVGTWVWSNGNAGLTIQLNTTIYSLTSIGQQIVLSNTANITPSKKLEKFNKEQARSFAVKRFKNDKVALSALTNSDHTYVVDSVLVTLYYENGRVSANHLSELKKGWDYQWGKLTGYTSNLETINNNKILVFYYPIHNVGYYNFQCWNNTYTKVVSGSLQFDMTDKAKANIVLADMLKNIKFTNN